ncbi:MAG: CDC27 family protein [Planctomycetaceae bacterium]|jgi:tetratricopeptide (TPR) repeat protein|nr:CDC27 family protein [Planctomycetaceae bacterium]
MKKILIFCGFFVFLFSGCDCRRTTHPNIAFTIEGGVNADSELRQKEDFDRSFAVLNSLESSPCLTETPGYEKLVSITDWLNKWIQRRTTDEHWQPDSALLEMETITRTVAATALETVQLLNLLQGKNVTDENGQPVVPSQSLEEERKKITELLTRLVTELKTMSVRCGIPGVADYSLSVAELQKKFAALESIPNLDAAGVRNFTRQLEKETLDFTEIAGMLEKYAAELRIEGLFIQRSDADYLKQCTWTRNLSNWARGEKQVLLERVVNLLDWTICNIDFRDKTVQITPNQSIEMPQQYPWQTMLLGYSTLWDRTWLFMELLRQQRIDAVLLSVPLPEQPELPLFWAVGVLLDGEVYLFLPAYGMPVPGHKPPTIAENGALYFPEIATLSQVLKDDQLLRQFDFSEQQKFPITSKLVQETTAYLLATPESASIRMKVLESELSGEQNMVLYTNLQEQRRLFSAIPAVKTVEIWKYPFRTKFEQLFIGQRTRLFMEPLVMPNPKRQDFPLWMGRVLYFKGQINGQENAITAYQNARVPDRDIMEYRKIDPNFRNNPVLAAGIQTVTINASYWLGLASFEINSITAAKDFLNSIQRNSLNPWQNGIEYVLGRIAEQEKKYNDAIQYYERTARSPAGSGNILRAKWLQKAVDLTEKDSKNP